MDAQTANGLTTKKTARPSFATAAGGLESEQVDYIKVLGLVRRIEREAARRGYNSDCTIDDSMLPDTGTRQQQLDIAAIGLDTGVRFSALSIREEELARRLLRRCVLSSNRKPVIQKSGKALPQNSVPQNSAEPSVKFAREWRRRA